MQGTFACFLFLPSFAVESSARNVQNGFTFSFGRERLFLFFCLANKRKEIDNKEINNAFRTAKRYSVVPQALSWVM